jgi:hypothetical protein
MCYERFPSINKRLGLRFSRIHAKVQMIGHQAECRNECPFILMALHKIIAAEEGQGGIVKRFLKIKGPQY